MPEGVCPLSYLVLEGNDIWTVKVYTMRLNMKTMVRSCMKHGTLLISLAICLGCAPFKTVPGYIVQPYYKSSITKDQITTKGLGSIRINTMEFDEPYVQDNPATIIKLIPILSLIPITDQTWKNTVPFDVHSKTTFTTLQKGDIENILVSEIKLSGMFNDVEYQGLPKDYDIKGRVNLTIETYIHGSGLGLLFYEFSLLAWFTLPMASFYYTCEAHFDVISTKDNKVIFSKDYLSKDKKWEGIIYHINPLHPTRARFSGEFGEDVFPVIVKEFVNDLQHNLKPQSSVAS